MLSCERSRQLLEVHALALAVLMSFRMGMPMPLSMPKRKLIKPILLVQLFNVLPRYIVAASAIPAADTGSWCSEVLVCESVLFFLLASWFYSLD